MIQENNQRKNSFVLKEAKVAHNSDCGCIFSTSPCKFD